MDQDELLTWTVRGIGALLSGLTAVLGVQGAVRVLDETRALMVAQGRGPTDQELDQVVARIETRSAEIQRA